MCVGCIVFSDAPCDSDTVAVVHSEIIQTINSGSCRVKCYFRTFEPLLGTTSVLEIRKYSKNIDLGSYGYPSSQPRFFEVFSKINHNIRKSSIKSSEPREYLNDMFFQIRGAQSQYLTVF